MASYDEDLNDERQRCPHGTFIGSWWGPDYICGYCEDGISVEEMYEIQAASARWGAEHLLAEGERLAEALTNALVGLPYQVRYAQVLVEYLSADKYARAWDLINA